MVQIAYFIDYWNKVVALWLDKHVNAQSEVVYANRPLDAKKECYYKDDHLTVNVETNQLPWFENKDTGKLLCPIHMPEPYWGNPDKCSIVIINYNPGGGLDMSPHTYKGKGAPYPDNTMIEYVNRKSYSTLALDFPLLKTKEELEKDERWWLRSYGGRKWWLQKKEWIEHLVDDWAKNGNKQSDEKESKLPIHTRRPFAIELCGWHSQNWNDSTVSIINNVYRKEYMQKYFIHPLLHSIEKSTTHLAVCIGKQFSQSLLAGNNDSCNINDITQTINVNCNDNTYQVVYDKKEKALKVIANNKTRHYRIYDIKHDNRSHIIINTWVQGSNHHPAKHFWPFEKSLINAIIQYQLKNKPIKND